MKNQLTFGFLFLLLFISCQQKHPDPFSQPVLDKKDIKRIVLIGGALISRMEQYGLFEQAMLQHYKGQEISFRNIGWPADDVFGMARSQFGSAQNTRSWKPPTTEEGFGSKVLMDHIQEASPSTLIIGYGSEVAFSDSEADFELFTHGYKRLLEHAEEKNIRLILLSPPQQEKTAITTAVFEQRNLWLRKASEFIQKEATDRGHLFIDLNQQLILDPRQQLYTENGVQLNQAGYLRMSEILLKHLGINNSHQFALKLDKQAHILAKQNCDIQGWSSTVNGASFHLTPRQMAHAGQFISKAPLAIYINGKLASKQQDTIANIYLRQDSLQQSQLLETIKEKNRLYRYRLQPLNEAYIYLFRRHEMGHLAYEMDNLNKLVSEKEKEIDGLIKRHTYFIEVELIKPWQPPRDYPEDEVPAFIPEPNIEEELAAFNITDGYEISLFAADPMIANPININWDTRGRAWVATSSTYPHIVPGREPNDKIIILEDTDKDGKADKHTVFAENLLIPHSVMPVPGGAYVTASTELLFLADTDGDDIADEKRVLFDGFGNADVHHMIHGLRWMPWGDLHFTQSIYINSFVETPYGVQVLNGSGIWSFRPEIERLEIFSRGLINPWGEAIDRWGQTFATDGAGSSGMNYLFPGSAHATAVGAPKVIAGLNSNTPKNTAAEFIYSTHFPPSWQGSVITNDFRANRTVRYELKPHLSGYQSQEVETVLRSDHRSYRPVDSKVGPDGALYIVDWYNPIIDHGEVDFHHPIRDKTHGRVWKLTKKGSPLTDPISFQQRTPSQLLNLLKSPNQFVRIQANRAFVEQNGDPQLVINWVKRLNPSSNNFSQYRLEGLWLLAALNHYDESLLLASLNSSKSQERAAAVRLLIHWKKQKKHYDVLQRLVQDLHPQVRLESLHALREMGGMQAAETAVAVLNRPMDENLEFALELSLRTLEEAWLPSLLQSKDIFEGDLNKQLYALLSIDHPKIISPLNQLVTQPGIDKNLAEKVWLAMAKMGDAQTKVRILERALEQQDAKLLNAMANAPSQYNASPNDIQPLKNLLSHQDRLIRIAALKLAARWKTAAFSELISGKLTTTTDISEKREALRALVAMGNIDQVKAMALSAPEIENRTVASTVWIEADPEAAAQNTVSLLEELQSTDLAEMLFIAFRRLENGPKILRQSLEGKRISEEIASVGLRVVQTSGLNLKELEIAIREAGSIQPVGTKMTSAEKAQLVQEAIEHGNRHRGRNIYRQKELLCATCHRINDMGGLSGPDLSTVGSYMAPNSILESILNPSTDIKQNYETVLVSKTNGEISSGLLARKTNNSMLLRQANSELIEIPNAEISKVDVSPVSLMPPGLSRSLHKDELRDLLAYLINLGKDN